MIQHAFDLNIEHEHLCVHLSIIIVFCCIVYFALHNKNYRAFIIHL